MINREHGHQAGQLRVVMDAIAAKLTELDLLLVKDVTADNYSTVLDRKFLFARGSVLGVNQHDQIDITLDSKGGAALLNVDATVITGAPPYLRVSIDRVVSNVVRRLVDEYGGL